MNRTVNERSLSDFMPDAGAFFRWFWLVCGAGSLFFILDAAGHRYRQLLYVGPDAIANTGQLRFEEAAALSELGLSIEFYAGYFTALEMALGLAAFVIGCILFLKRSRDWMPWLLSLGLITLILFSSPLTSAIDEIHPGLFRVLVGLRTIGLGSFIISLLIFPDGKFVPSGIRWLVVIWLGYLLASVVFPSLRFRSNILWESPTDLAIMLLFLFYLTAIGWIQVYRYRNYASPVQRQQTRWVVYSIGLGFSAMLLSSLPFLFIPIIELSLAQVMLARMVSFSVILLAGFLAVMGFTAAILYSRLWDIDIIIRRTLQYGILSAVLAGAYFLVVVLLQDIAGRLSGDSDSPLITVISTLTIAALFNPLRIRIQEFIDRRFYRRKYDAERTLARFSAAARDEVDLENLSAAILGAVNDTLRPEAVKLWLKPLKNHSMHRQKK